MQDMHDDMAQRFVVAGLGNPGEEYAHTRHNAGFDVVDELARTLGVTYWKRECGALTACVKIGDTEVILIKPQSFMNTSGGPVSKVLKEYDVAPANLIVVHDDLDIPAGKIRVKFGGGLAGHNGLKSICDKTASKEWFRVRIGIDRPPGRMPVVDYVLKMPKGSERDDFDQAIDLGAQAVVSLIEEGLVKTQDRFN